MKSIFLQKLQEREEQNLLRHLQLPTGIDFCSNDYLSFAIDIVLQKRIQKTLAEVPSGSTGSRLLRGHNAWSENLELQLAQFCSRESALFFPSGYQANLAALSTVLNKESIVFSDEFNHASLVDGIRLSGAHKQIFKHNDLEDLEQKLALPKTESSRYVVVESLYSMQGDRAPLKAIADLCLRYGAQLIVDEAHATGVFGSGFVDRQSLQNKVLLSIHCAGKALGVSGAWIACDAVMRDYFVNFCRPFIYSTAPSPLISQALSEALQYWTEVGQERANLCLEKSLELKKQLSVFFRDDILLGDGPILFLNLQNNLEALSWSHYLQSCDLDVRAIRYPTVPENHAGLRISIHANQSPEDLKKLVSALKQRVLEC